MHFFTRNASLLHNCAAELLVKVLKLFETVIYLLVYRKCFKRREKKGIISEEHFSLAAEQSGEGSFICSRPPGQAPHSPAAPQALLQGNLTSLRGKVMSLTRTANRSKPWCLCLGLEVWGSSRSFLFLSLLPGCRSPGQLSPPG